MPKTSRKSIWDPPTEAPGGSKEPAEKSFHRSQSPQHGSIPATTIIEQLRMPGKKKRNRSWERANRAMLVRGVPPKLRAAVKEIAEDLDVRIDDVARAFLEFGLHCYQKGEIKIHPVLSEQRLTLFPKWGASWGSTQQPGWMEKLWDFQPPAKKSQLGKKGRDQNKPWKWQVSYRGIPVGVQEALRQIYKEHNVPLGEVVTVLLGYSLEAYKAGRLLLNPQPERD